MHILEFLYNLVFNIDMMLQIIAILILKIVFIESIDQSALTFGRNCSRTQSR